MLSCQPVGGQHAGVDVGKGDIAVEVLAVRRVVAPHREGGEACVAGGDARLRRLGHTVDVEFAVGAVVDAGHPVEGRGCRIDRATGRKPCVDVVPDLDRIVPADQTVQDGHAVVRSSS